MKKNAARVTNDIESLADGAKALVAATAGLAEDKIIDARKRLAAALDKGVEAWAFARDKAVDGVGATGDAIQSNPYTATGLALGVGALLGFLIGRRD